LASSFRNLGKEIGQHPIVRPGNTLRQVGHCETSLCGLAVAPHVELNAIDVQLRQPQLQRQQL